MKGGLLNSSVAEPLLVSKKILVIRGQRVLLDSDLAVLHVVKTLRLNEQVRRNADRCDDCISSHSQRIVGLTFPSFGQHDLKMSNVAPIDIAPNVAGQIQTIRGHRAILDSDLAVLYGVTTKALNQAVRRNHDRFPADFLFQLTDLEAQSLRSQSVTLDNGRGKYGKYAPLAFTEHGAIMAATILNSPRAAEMSVYVVRAFVRARELFQSNTELARELTALKQSVATLDAETRRQFDQVYEAILGLMNPAVRRQ